MSEDFWKQLPTILVAGWVLLRKYAPDILNSLNNDDKISKKDFEELEDIVKEHDKTLRNHGETISNINGKLSK